MFDHRESNRHEGLCGRGRRAVSSAASSLVTSTLQTVATAQALPTVVVSTLLSTPSQSTLNQANTTISNFVSSYTSPSPSINKSSP